ncbi:hypothetical protein V2J09_015160, partial [Rumex salicifolius]
QANFPQKASKEFPIPLQQSNSISNIKSNLDKTIIISYNPNTPHLSQLIPKYRASFCNFKSNSLRARNLQRIGALKDLLAIDYKIESSLKKNNGFSVSRNRVKLGKTGEFLEGALDCIHEIKDALGSVMTADSSYRVETTSRLAQWRIGHLSTYTYRKSDPFKIGKWNWHLGVERSRALFVKLFPEVSSFTRENPPIASFVIRVLCSAGDRKPLLHPDVRDKQIKNSDDFSWTIDLPLTGSSNSGALSALGRMLSDSILTDLTIHVSDGGTHRAHRAVLASRSPVFRSMFSPNNHPSDTITISDLSSDTCWAFLSYLYGSIDSGDFLRHRLALLGAADKYDVADLKEACHLSLMEDIDAGNVLERLRSAWMYRVEGLKSACLRYLVGFGRVCDLKEEFGAFVRLADKELVTEVFMEILSTWKDTIFSCFLNANSLRNFNATQTSSTKAVYELDRHIKQSNLFQFRKTMNA